MKNKIFTLSLLLCATDMLSSVTHTTITKTVNTSTAANTNQIYTSFEDEFSKSIMNIILKNQDFHYERDSIKAFLNSTTIPHDYDQLIDALHNAAYQTPYTTEAIEAIERAVMTHLRSHGYMLRFENKWLNVFTGGIKWNWISPKSWFSRKEWFNDSSLIVKECMSRLRILSIISARHSDIITIRLNATIESYLHWKKNLIVGAAAYLAANAVCRGWKDSSAKKLKNGGLVQTPVVISQIKNDAIDSYEYASNIIQKTSNKAINILQPIAETIMYGDEYHKQKDNQ